MVHATRTGNAQTRQVRRAPAGGDRRVPAPDTLRGGSFDATCSWNPRPWTGDRSSTTAATHATDDTAPEPHRRRIAKLTQWIMKHRMKRETTREHRA
jgi:hypothetical protein